MNSKILIVEDDASFGTMLQKWFERNNFSPVLCSEMQSAKEKLLKSSFDLVLSDLRLPDGDGIILLNWMNERRLNTPVIIMTSYGEISTAVSAIKLGAADFLEKPLNPSVLKEKIEAILCAPKPDENVSKKRATSVDTQSAKGKFVEGKSPLTVQMRHYVDLVAPTLMAVMIVGESGTGKEHTARMIHDRSDRSNGPFVAVDCGVLSMELAPSELFGHKKGSFTSAVEDKKGVFEEADGGTLFLDEVGNLPYGVQKQLLRALQEKKIRPVGSNTDIAVNVRLVTATNEDLEKAIAAGTFREDLYHRLNEFMIQIPPLRKCLEDIGAYAEHFMNEANAELDKHVRFIEKDALQRLKNYSWPGNLRELRNVIRRAVLFSTDDTIRAESIYLPTEKVTDSDELSPEPLSLNKNPETEIEKIKAALAKVNGNKSQAARMLGIDRKTLYNKLHLYGIDT
jgi:two-component system response regulator HydG